MSIKIVTKLDYRVGGRLLHCEYTTGPRHLMKAIDEVGGIRRENVENYGNVGCGKTWIEVDGVEIDRDDILHSNVTDRRRRRELGITRTECAQNLLKSIKRVALQTA